MFEKRISTRGEDAENNPFGNEFERMDSEPPRKVKIEARRSNREGGGK